MYGVLLSDSKVLMFDYPVPVNKVGPRLITDWELRGDLLTATPADNEVLPPIPTSKFVGTCALDVFMLGGGNCLLVTRDLLHILANRELIVRVEIQDTNFHFTYRASVPWAGEREGLGLAVGRHRLERLWFDKKTVATRIGGRYRNFSAVVTDGLRNVVSGVTPSVVFSVPLSGLCVVPVEDVSGPHRRRYLLYTPFAGSSLHGLDLPGDALRNLGLWVEVDSLPRAFGECTYANLASQSFLRVRDGGLTLVVA